MPKAASELEQLIKKADAIEAWFDSRNVEEIVEDLTPDQLREIFEILTVAQEPVQASYVLVEPVHITDEKGQILCTLYPVNAGHNFGEGVIGLNITTEHGTSASLTQKQGIHGTYDHVSIR